METTTFPKSSGSANASGASAGASAGIESAKSSFSNGIDKTAAPARQAVDRFSSFAHETVDKVADVANRYSDVPTKAFDTSKTWVQDQPMVAVGAALVLGLVIGRLTSN